MGPHPPGRSRLNMLARLRAIFTARRSRRIAAINAAYASAKASYDAAKRRGDTRAMHDAADALKAAQTARLSLETDARGPSRGGLSAAVWRLVR